MARCASCGANVSSRDRVCSYCGAENLKYQPPADQVNVLLEKGMKAYREEQYALAIDYYRQVIEMDPHVFTAYFYLAEGLNLLGRPEEAITAMKKAREIRPGNTAVCYNLGVLFKHIGQKAKARECLEEALTLVETDVSLQNRERMKQAIQIELSQLK